MTIEEINELVIYMIGRSKRVSLSRRVVCRTVSKALLKSNASTMT